MFDGLAQQISFICARVVSLSLSLWPRRQRRIESFPSERQPMFPDKPGNLF